MYVLILSFLTAFALTYFTLPSIISIARAKRLCDEPNDRSSHQESTPSLGGVGIFAGSVFSVMLWTPFQNFVNLQYILCALIIIFFIGAKDDISPVSASTKILGQFLAAAIVVFKSDILLHGFYGVFGIQDPGWMVSVLLTIFTILVIINAFNLIDGINGLAGTIGLLITIVLGAWYVLVDHFEYALIAFAIAGAVLAFLKYNYSPAKIFMGDTGSLLLGLVLSVLIIKFIDLNSQLEAGHAYKFEAIPVVAIGILIIPLFDTLRVFTTRALRGQSPFRPDRRHIHHLLVDYGFTHMKATTSLAAVNLFFMGFVFILHDQLNLHFLLFLVVLMASAMTYGLHRAVIKKNLRAKKQKETESKRLIRQPEMT